MKSRFGEEESVHSQSERHSSNHHHLVSLHCRYRHTRELRDIEVRDSAALAAAAAPENIELLAADDATEACVPEGSISRTMTLAGASGEENVSVTAPSWPTRSTSRLPRKWRGQFEIGKIRGEEITEPRASAKCQNV